MEKLYIDLSIPLYSDFTGCYIDDGEGGGGSGGGAHNGHYICLDGSHYKTADGLYYTVK